MRCCSEVRGRPKETARGDQTQRDRDAIARVNACEGWSLLGRGVSGRSCRVVALVAVAVRASGAEHCWRASYRWLRANNEDGCPPPP